MAGRRGAWGLAVTTVVTAVAASLLTPAVSTAAPVAPDRLTAAAPSAQEAVDYRFVSAPDLLNSDIGDVSRLPGYRGGPNSTNPSFERALDLVHDSIAAERPDDVLVAGDMVEGHWTHDQSRRNYFRAKPGAPLIRAAGRLYYSQWRQRFASRGLDVHTAVGDHEIGDNDWRRHGTAVERSRWRNFNVFKNVYADQLVRDRYRDRPTGQARRTAYATRLSPEVQLVTLDVFRRTSTSVAAQVDPQQLRWLRRVLSRARADGVDWIVVQGHVPILGQVRERHSSGLTYRGGPASALWKTMRRYGVDLYLNGEVHDVTVRRRDGITQISHGGIFGPLTSYLTGAVTGTTMRLEVREFRGRRGPTSQRLWGLDPGKAQPRTLSLRPSRTTGRLVLGADQRLIEARGRLRPAR